MLLEGFLELVSDFVCMYILSPMAYRGFLNIFLYTRHIKKNNKDYKCRRMISDFAQARRAFIFNFLHEKANKYCQNRQRSYKNTFMIFRALPLK
jgi:hypothetical protein